MKQQILITGGTGKTGSRVATRLQKLNHSVRIGSRNSTPPFNWDDPSTYSPALKSMDRAYIVYYPDLAVPGAREAIADFTRQALKEGLEKVVLLSGKGEKEAEACEAIVAESGLNYTLVRASWFSQNFSESFLLDPLLSGHVALPMADVQIPFVDVNDIADIVAAALLDDSYNGETITVTGPDTLTFPQVVHKIAQASGRAISFSPITIDEYVMGMKQAGLPEDYVWLFGYLFREVLGNPDNQEVSYDVQKILGRKATSFDTYVKNTVESGVWNQEVTSI